MAMAKKTKNAATAAEEMPEKAKKEATSEKEEVKTEERKTEKRAPQMVTVNGDKVTHGHIFKSNKSEDWFFTAKINGVPLKPQVVSNQDMDDFMTKKIEVPQLMEKYYPTKIMPKINVDEFKLPQTIKTGDGEQQVTKFNVYKQTDVEAADFGKYRFYAQVGDKRMSCTASKEDLNAYFDLVQSPKAIIAKNFGDKLGLAEHYQQFQLPEGMNIEGKDIKFKKNTQTNRFEISIEKPEFSTSSKEVSYEDRQAYFQYKTATKDQLAAKYLNHELNGMTLGNSNKQQQSMQKSMAIA